MAKIPEHLIQEIKDRVNIREVVEEYVHLKKAGANYKGLCPFHQEKTPSFNVHEGKGIYKCFGCGESGNVFGFLMKMENMGFTEAAQRLAARAGIEIPKEKERIEDQEKEQAATRLFAANAAAAKFFQESLLHLPEAGPAREYLERRGMTAETIARYRLGYAPASWSATQDNLTAQGLTIADLHAAGLVIARDNGGFYDRFRGRLMFPIQDVQGRVRGFGARQLLDEPDQPKYINSPETLIYKKGLGFYGIYQAKEAIRRQGRAVIVEGYFDQIALDQAGIAYAVATLGTALTPEHAQMIRRYAAEVFVVFDSDEAGKKASLRSLEIFLEAGLSPRIVLIPAGKDPDEFLRANSAADFEKLLSAAPPLLSYYIDNILAEAGSTPANLAQAVGQAAEMIARVQEPIERSVFADQLARKSGVALPQVEARVQRPKTRPEAKSEAGGQPEEFTGPQAELDLIRLLIHHPETAARIEESGALAKFRHDGLAALGRSLLAQQREIGKIDPAAILHRLADPGLVARITKIMLERDPFAGTETKSLAELIRSVFQGELRARLSRIPVEIQQARDQGDEGKWRSLLDEQQVLRAELAGLAAEQAG